MSTTPTSSRRPVIGITVDHNADQDQYLAPHSYSLAVQAAGGLPLLLPYRADVSLVPQYVDLLDGILFSGGNDLDPKSWGETYHPMAKPVDPNREMFERALMAEVEKRRTPTLAICLGSQLMNVYRGGSMHQFVPDLGLSPAIEHRKLPDAPWPRHEVRVEKDSTLAGILGSDTAVANSSHKQAMNRIGRGLRVVARAPDGVVEAIEDPTMPMWVGTQWHPERLIDDPQHLKLFERLVYVAKTESSRR
jgi:putative glutamine amidotransferase